MKLFVKLFLFIHLFLLSANASAVLIAPSTFTIGDTVRFSIEVVGTNIQFPVIKKIDGFVVESIGTSKSITSINGQINAKVTKRFQFVPTKDITIPSFTVVIDGQNYTTMQRELKNVQAEKTTSNFFDFDISIKKKSLYVGEDTILSLMFKYRKDVQILDLSFKSPSFDGFWAKQLDTSRKYETGQYIVQELEFLLFPQKSGRLKIEPIKIEAKILDIEKSQFSMFGNAAKVMKIYSNALEIESKKLPDNVNLIGKFEIKTSVSTNEIKEGESVSYKINVTGTGNIDDVDDYSLSVPNTTIYTNNPDIQTSLKDNKYQGSYEKTFSLLGESDFTIPAIEFKYFDKNLNQVVMQKTPSYDIKVQAKPKMTSSSQLQKKEVATVKTKEVIVYKTSTNDRVLFFVLGCVFSILIIGLYFYVITKSNKTKDDLPLVKRIKQSKTKQELIKVLVPYLGSYQELDDLIFELEKDENLELKLKKKQLIQTVQSLKINEG